MLLVKSFSVTWIGHFRFKPETSSDYHKWNTVDYFCASNHCSGASWSSFSWSYRLRFMPCRIPLAFSADKPAAKSHAWFLCGPEYNKRDNHLLASSRIESTSRTTAWSHLFHARRPVRRMSSILKPWKVIQLLLLFHDQWFFWILFL